MEIREKREKRTRRRTAERVHGKKKEKNIMNGELPATRIKKSILLSKGPPQERIREKGWTLISGVDIASRVRHSKSFPNVWM